jgi:hypothetical protein
VAVSLLVFPERAHGLGVDAAARILGQLANALPKLLTGFTKNLPEDVIRRIQDDIGEAVTGLQVITAEAERKRLVNLVAEPDPGRLSRILLRLRHDLVIIGRGANRPLPDALRPVHQACPVLWRSIREDVASPHGPGLLGWRSNRRRTERRRWSVKVSLRRLDPPNRPSAFDLFNLCVGGPPAAPLSKCCGQGAQDIVGRQGPPDPHQRLSSFWVGVSGRSLAADTTRCWIQTQSPEQRAI